EGFETVAGKYLPDFYLEEFGQYVEVKPRIDLVTQYDFDRLTAFKAGVLILTGQPWPSQYAFWRVRGGKPVKQELFWGNCPVCGRIQPLQIVSSCWGDKQGAICSP